jgi:uncharacterized protein YndB with AHSA1/START domain
MSEQIIHNTFVIERNYAAKLERVFAAFSDPATKLRWYGEGRGHTVENFEMDFRVGGVDRLHYRFGPDTPFPGVILTNEGSYQDIVPDSRIVAASSMSIGGRFVSASLLTFEFRPSEKGTDLIFTHQGTFLEGSGGPEMRQAGWQKLFDNLAKELGIG